MSKTFFKVLAVALLILCTAILIAVMMAPVPVAADIAQVSAARKPKVVQVAAEPTPPALSVVDQVRLYAGEHANLALRVSKCESGHQTKIRGKFDPRDRGLFQINSRWNPQVSDQCAFDVQCSTEWFVSEVEAGRLWKWKYSQSCWDK